MCYNIYIKNRVKGDLSVYDALNMANEIGIKAKTATEISNFLKIIMEVVLLKLVYINKL